MFPWGLFSTQNTESELLSIVAQTVHCAKAPRGGRRRIREDGTARVQIQSMLAYQPMHSRAITAQRKGHLFLIHIKAYVEQQQLWPEGLMSHILTLKPPMASYLPQSKSQNPYKAQ